MIELLNTFFPIHTTSPRTDCSAHFSVSATGSGDIALDAAFNYPNAGGLEIECANMTPDDAFELGSRLIEEAYKAEGRECLHILAVTMPELPPVAEALYRQAVRQMGEF